jgi:hypothetical protein
MSVNGVQVAERVLHTSDTRLASVLMVFGAQLRNHLPLDWADIHQGRDRFVRYLEEKKKREDGYASSYEFEPKPHVTFYFDGSTVPAYELVEAFHGDYTAIDGALEDVLKEIPQPIQNRLRDAISCLIACACHQALLNREFLVKQIKRVPEWAKWDEVHEGNKAPVRIGKRSSPQLRAQMLDKL